MTQPIVIVPDDNDSQDEFGNGVETGIAIAEAQEAQEDSAEAVVIAETALAIVEEQQQEIAVINTVQTDIGLALMQGQVEIRDAIVALTDVLIRQEESEPVIVEAEPEPEPITPDTPPKRKHALYRPIGRK